MLVATEDALFLEGPDVLEDGDLAGAELIGELLHGGSVAVKMAVISDGDQNVELAGREIHGGPFLAGLERFGGCFKEHYPNNRERSMGNCKKR